MIDMLADGNGWIALGMLLIILEMVLGTAYALISFGIGSLITGGAIKMSWLPTMVEDLLDESLVMGTLSLVTLVAIRLIFNKKGSEDINKY
jgi:membrane protein implicated in regulation of membrane protease activity